MPRDVWCIFCLGRVKRTSGLGKFWGLGGRAKKLRELVKCGRVAPDAFFAWVPVINYISMLDAAATCAKLDALVAGQAGRKSNNVFTPLPLVQNMLDALPHHVWEDPELTFLEPAAGVGHFCYGAYQRLMVGLAERLPDAEARSEHIMRHMLHMVERDETHFQALREFFPGAAHCACADFFDAPFGQKRFDVVMGNPPFQRFAAGPKRAGAKGAGGGMNCAVYMQFAERALDVLAPGGYLVFVHPFNWRKPGSHLLPRFLGLQLLRLEINTANQAFKGVDVKLDWYVLRNQARLGAGDTTRVRCWYKRALHDNVMALPPDAPFLANFVTPAAVSVLAKLLAHGTRRACVRSSACHKTRAHVKAIADFGPGDELVYRYPLHNTVSRPRDYYSSRPHPAQHQRKVILSFCSYGSLLHPLYDNGHLGTTEHALYFAVDTAEQGAAMLAALESRSVLFATKICKWASFQNEPALLSSIGFPDVVPADDPDLFGFYGLTHPEAQLVQSVLAAQ